MSIHVRIAIQNLLLGIDMIGGLIFMFGLRNDKRLEIGREKSLGRLESRCLMRFGYVRKISRFYKNNGQAETFRLPIALTIE